MNLHEYPTDHRGLAVLDLDECMRRLRQVVVGRIVFVHDGEPVVLPVNHGVDGNDIVFRTTWGAKLQQAQHAHLVAFEVDDFDEQLRRGWSVLVTGKAEVVYDENEIDRLERLGVHSWAKVLDPVFWVRIRPQQVSGREIRTD
jgi:nitroimidazol reductase NimA-like FMN-containing flavoprotein (pyridoxamine 5'-phosphate oxidase superfamily)